MLDSFNWAAATPRIVQYDNKRYALRLEAIFWRQLEQLAKRQQWRQGRLIAELDKLHDGVNLSSFVRGFCMVEAEKDASRFRLSSGAFDLVDVLQACPAPGLLLSHERIILEVNPALYDWAGRDTVFHQQKFDIVFEPRVTRSLDETIGLLRTGKMKRTQIQVVFQGRAMIATLTALSVGSIFYCLVWLSPGRNAAR